MQHKMRLLFTYLVAMAIILAAMISHPLYFDCLRYVSDERILMKRKVVKAIKIGIRETFISVSTWKEEEKA